MHLGKPVENRKWSTKYRGDLVIHAGLDRKFMRRYDLPKWEAYYKVKLPPPADILYGVALGVVKLVDCVPFDASMSIWHTGPYCWLLENPRPFRHPIVCKGNLGLWDFVMPKSR